MFVTLTRDEGGVATLLLNRPERMNALSVALAEDLLAALEEIASDGTIGAVVLTGAGRGFCAGGDVKEMVLNRDKTLEQRHADLAMMHLIPKLLVEMPQVVVAAVNGAAFGAGLAVALTCDIVLAAKEARFGTAFLKQGLTSDFGLSYQLTRLAGPAAARRIIYTDQVLGASEAQSLGLVSSVYEAGALMPAARDMASKIAAWPGAARAGLKSLLRQAETATHAEMLAREAEMQGGMIVSDDHAAAVDMFNSAPAARARKEFGK